MSPGGRDGEAADEGGLRVEWGEGSAGAELKAEDSVPGVYAPARRRLASVKKSEPAASAAGSR